MAVLPKISVVTTNYNGAAFLEQALRSVLDQPYPNLEYIVIDGGSTDGSQQIIEQYAPRLAYWESERDRGFAHAYNKGFARATGDILAYLNSDDMYCPWALEIVGRCFLDVPAMEWLTTLFPLVHSPEAGFVHLEPMPAFNRDLFYAGYYGGLRPFIQQESTFWRRSLWEKAGGRLDETLRLAIDADLWARFFALADLYAVATPLAGFRMRPDSKSGANMPAYIQEFSQSLAQARRQSAARPRWTARTVNRVTRRLFNVFPDRLVPPPWRFTGKTVDWDFAGGKFTERDTRVVL